MNRNTTVLLLTVALWGLSFQVHAQIDSVRFNKYYLKKYWVDTKGMIASPAHWDNRDWTRFGIFVAGTASLITVDAPVQKFWQHHQYHWADNVSTYGLEPFGAAYSGAIVLGFLGHGLICNKSKSFSTGLLATESFVLASLFARIPKMAFGRLRPDANPNVSPTDWQGPFEGSSFPSGHTTAIFAVASVIANQYRDTDGHGRLILGCITGRNLAHVRQSALAQRCCWSAVLGTPYRKLCLPPKRKQKNGTVLFRGKTDRFWDFRLLTFFELNLSHTIPYT
jgi:membrane-associated phospholipid phosphatase